MVCNPLLQLSTVICKFNLALLHILIADDSVGNAHDAVCVEAGATLVQAGATLVKVQHAAGQFY